MAKISNKKLYALIPDNGIGAEETTLCIKSKLGYVELRKRLLKNPNLVCEERLKCSCECVDFCTCTNVTTLILRIWKHQKCPDEQ